jgi:hypothetical protein
MFPLRGHHISHENALALTAMIRDSEITRCRAVTMARMVLRENAVALYGFGEKARETP